jgi:hypothetical protein
MKKNRREMKTVKWKKLQKFQTLQYKKKKFLTESNLSHSVSFYLGCKQILLSIGTWKVLKEKNALFLTSTLISRDFLSANLLCYENSVWNTHNEIPTIQWCLFLNLFYYYHYYYFILFYLPYYLCRYYYKRWKTTYLSHWMFVRNWKKIEKRTLVLRLTTAPWT